MVVWVAFFLIFNVVQAFSSEDIMKELEKVQHIVEEQNFKILELEKRQEEQTGEIKGLQETVNTQRRELGDVKQEMQSLKEKCRKDSMRMIPNTENQGPIAFYAYMSSSMSGVGVHHTLVFDVVKTNVGGGYYPSGVFFVPQSGLYVFTWSFRITANAYHTVELAVNGNTVGATHGRDNGDQDQISATVVISVNKGDDVYLRSGDTYNQGDIYSDHWGYTYFAGWSIM